MYKTKAGALAIAALVIGTVVVPDHEQKHIEQRQHQEESKLTMEVLISTRSGTAPTTISINPPKQFE